MDMQIVDSVPPDAKPLNEVHITPPGNGASSTGALSQFNPKTKGIDFTTPDGTRITIEKQSSLSRFVDQILGETTLVNPMLLERKIRFIKALLSITKINDKPVGMVNKNAIEYADLEQRLGDDNVDQVYMMFYKHFPAADSDEITDVKKF